MINYPDYPDFGGAIGGDYPDFGYDKLFGAVESVPAAHQQTTQISPSAIHENSEHYDMIDAMIWYGLPVDAQAQHME